MKTPENTIQWAKGKVQVKHNNYATTGYKWPEVRIGKALQLL